MSSRKKRDGESSLELLLDTMCNTFGGVMFIGIALVVLMAMLSSKTKIPDDMKHNMARQQQLVKLQQELSKLSHDNSILETTVRNLENDPRKELLAELLQLEDRKCQNEIEISIVKKQQSLIQQESQLRRKEKENVQADLKKIAETNSEKEKRLRELEKKIASMKQKINMIAEQTMMFRVMKKSTKRFYGLIVWQNQLWRVGPDFDAAKQSSTVNEACHSEKIQLDGQLAYRCTPIQGKGIPIISNGVVSPEAIALLKNIPSDCTPKFTLAKDSIESFALLRQYMKGAHILHGIDVYFEQERCFVFKQISEKIEYYEY